MGDGKDYGESAWWAHGLDDVDREIARLAAICGLRVLDPGVIERVLHDDASVCRHENALAFRKLRDALMMHYSIRERSADAVGEAQTRAIVDEIVERLRRRFGDSPGTPEAG